MRGLFDRRGRRRLLRYALLGSIVWPAQAWCADDDTIIVTARRTTERTADVPLAVDVVPAGDIGAGGIDGLQSLAAHVPGLSFESAWGGSNSFPVLRGQSQPSISGDNVGMFVDGVYQNSRDALDVEPLDLDRIEVVHGPQSALFGHSTFAGLIHYVPAQPTETLLAKASVDAGTDDLLGATVTISGPLGTAVKGRLAAGWRQAEGTWENEAEPGQHLGNYRRFAFAASFATRDDSGPLKLRLAGRYGDNRSNHPPSFPLDYRTYNCGARDTTSGAWSYFCGKAPIPARVALSPALPDSRARTGQIALQAALDLGDVELRSDTSLYRADSDVIRDLDGSAEGDLYGVCLQSVNCTGIGGLVIPVVRLQRVNIVLQRSLAAREITQELRVRSIGERRFTWEAGAMIFWSRQHSTLAFGGERGRLTGGERLSSLVLTNPQRVGAPATINLALVDDPNADQRAQNDSVERRRTIAAFAVADYRLTDGLRVRSELRSTWEQLTLDSRRANFAPSFGDTFGTRRFHDITPRFSIDWRPARDWLAFASYARGSRSGGINAFPNLLLEEQTFAPETNWTTELGIKFSGAELLRAAQVTVYDIDWRDTQIQGNAITPGFTALIIRNTRGIHTQGVEAAATLVPAAWLSFDLAWSYADPRFKRGSEGPGDNGVCGLSATNTISSFCTIVTSTIDPGQLVPNISGNRVYRAPTTTWRAAVTLAPRLAVLPGWRVHADVTHQGNVFDRQVNGLFYGARTLLGARLTMPFGRAALDLWGTNLTGQRYIRVAASRQPAFYLGQPRPTDMMLGDGRRFGLTLSCGF